LKDHQQLSTDRNFIQIIPEEDTVEQEWELQLVLTRWVEVLTVVLVVLDIIPHPHLKE